MKIVKLGLFLFLNAAASLSALAVDRINITDYGAIPNDGNDDTAAINAAIAAGKSIYFPPGVYNYTGRISLPITKSYRLYGDGPGVSIIAFTGPTAGIYGSNIGPNTLNVEGLTLRALTAAAGTAISASFSDPGGSTKFHTATIHNVEISGNQRVGNTAGYWSTGIYLSRAQNAVIDKVDISGNFPLTATGISWTSPPDIPTTGIQITNAEVKWCSTGVKTSGWVEGFYMSSFEVAFCGAAGSYALDLASSRVTLQSPAFNLTNGHVDMVSGGVKMTNLSAVKVSHVDFQHTDGAAVDGTHLQLTNCIGVVISDNTFTSQDSVNIVNENGVFLTTTKFARISGNIFRGLTPNAGSCIVAYNGSTTVRVTENIFATVRMAYDNYIGTEFYYDADNIIK